MLLLFYFCLHNVLTLVKDKPQFNDSSFSCHNLSLSGSDHVGSPDAGPAPVQQDRQGEPGGVLRGLGVAALWHGPAAERDQRRLWRQTRFFAFVQLMMLGCVGGVSRGWRTDGTQKPSFAKSEKQKWIQARLWRFTLKDFTLMINFAAENLNNLNESSGWGKASSMNRSLKMNPHSLWEVFCQCHLTTVHSRLLCTFTLLTIEPVYLKCPSPAQLLLNTQTENQTEGALAYLLKPM